MVKEILWTEQAERHIDRHQVTPGEVEDVVQSRASWRKNSRNEAMTVFGTTSAGRYLVVVTAEAMDGRVYVATARDMSATEQWLFRKKGH